MRDGSQLMADLKWGLFGSNASSQHSRLWVLRSFFFGVLVYDLIAITFKHAARYGVDDFNVPHFSWLSAILPIPDPMLIGTLWVLCAFAASLAALNVYAGTMIRVVAAIYGGGYFWSQIDSYQHHYLNAIIAFILALMPSRVWKGPSAPDAQPPSGALIGLLYLELGLIYFWTAVAKLDATWLSGATMMSIGHSDQLLVFTSHLSEVLYGTSGDPLLSLDALYKTLSTLIVVGEVFVAFCFFCPPLRKIGLILAPIFHLSVEFLGLDIELFSIYMIGINLILLSPDKFWRRLDTFWLAHRSWISIKRAGYEKGVLCCATVFCTIALYEMPFTWAQSKALALALSITAGLVGVWTWMRKPGATTSLWVSVALVCTGIFLPQLLQKSGANYDYHRMLGGDLSRRLPSPQSPSFERRLETAVSVYGVANLAMPLLPARRDKQARLILRGSSPERYDRAAQLLNQAYELHRAYIGRLQRSLDRTQSAASLETIIKAEHGLTTIAKSLRRLPATYRTYSDRALALTESEMSQDSQRHLTQLGRLRRQNVRTELAGVLETLAKEGRYAPSEDQLSARVKGIVGVGCVQSLKALGRWALLRSQMRLGRKDAIGSPLMTNTIDNGDRCESHMQYPISGIISARAQSTALVRLTRSHKRLFSK